MGGGGSSPRPAPASSLILQKFLTGVMHEADNAYSIWSTWLCYRLVHFDSVVYLGAEPDNQVFD